MRSFSRAAAAAEEEEDNDHANIRRKISLSMEQQKSDEIIVQIEVRLIKLIIFNLWFDMLNTFSYQKKILNEKHVLILPRTEIKKNRIFKMFL